MPAYGTEPAYELCRALSLRRQITLVDPLRANPLEAAQHARISSAVPLAREPISRDLGKRRTTNTYNMSFSFGFSGDDIEDEAQVGRELAQEKAAAPPPSSAFPVAGKPLLPPTRHDLEHMLSQLPSKVAYSTLSVVLDNGETIELPRRELWDVRVQIMAEEDDSGESEPGLGTHDVKTGVYEGGFKSWESSVDLVKVLAQSRASFISAGTAPCLVEVCKPACLSRAGEG